MITVSIYKQRDYSIPTARVKKKLQEVLAREGVSSDCSVSLAFVGRKKMDELAKKYYKGDPKNLYIHPILTFPYKDENALGEIVILYDEVENEKNLLDLVEHGAMHLLGIHH